MTINYRILKNKLADILADWTLPSPTEEEQTLIDALRDGIRVIPPLKEQSSIISEQEWNRNRMKLRHKILTRDPRNFLRWPVVLFTMFHDAKLEELDYLKNLSSWPTYEKALAENQIGHPKAYAAFPASSGNLIHHAYSFALLSELFSVAMTDCTHIFEFGGGYGSSARLAYQLGFAGNYIIFDLPEFSLLQKYYLSSILELGLNFNTDTLNPKTVSLVTTLAQANEAIAGGSIDIFLALWSLSESPIELREQVFVAIPEPSYFLIAYQERFNSIDNLDYFKKFAAARPDYTWTDFPIVHLPGHRYLLGKK